MAEQQKDKWEKADVILKPVGGLLTALAVACAGFFGSRYLERSQAADTNSRVYAELMSKREEADSNLRKDMFNSIIGTFLSKDSKKVLRPEQKVLNLELLAYNFHESLDLGPLFKHVYTEMVGQKLPGVEQYLDRLKRAAGEVKTKQIAALQDAGGKIDGQVDLDALDEANRSTADTPIVIPPAIEGTLRIDSRSGEDRRSSLIREFTLETLFADREKKEVKVKLEVRTRQSGGSSEGAEPEILSWVFWVGYFDFPMIDNVRLSHGERCAIVLKTFEASSAQLTLVYFPGSRASLKEKPFYDEVIDLLQTRRDSGGSHSK
ncbi:MAG: hypothetical protein DMF61_03480 [Blastocatellia bacterium AA13]|nr:MAG: hypothetical protein DMF61_03480 [Blastocatellia bacterium AA13]